MSTRRAGPPFLGVSIAVVTAVTLLLVQQAHADFLQWGTTPLTTGSVGNGYGFAEDALCAENARNIRRYPNEVTGFIGGTSITIIFIATAPRVTAVVMVIGADRGEAARVRDAVVKRIKGIVQFD